MCSTLSPIHLYCTHLSQPKVYAGNSGRRCQRCSNPAQLIICRLSAMRSPYTMFALPTCTAQLLSRLLDAGLFRSALPRSPDVPHWPRCSHHLQRHLVRSTLGSTPALSSTLLKDTVCASACVSGRFSRAVEEFVLQISVCEDGVDRGCVWIQCWRQAIQRGVGVLI